MGITGTIDEYKAGHQGAFKELYLKYRKAVRGYIVSHAFGHLRSLADDIEQETWNLIWEKREQYDPGRSFYSFVCFWAGIMIKRYVMGEKKVISLDDETGDKLESTEPGPETGMSHQQEELLTLIANHGGPPHQLLAFCFNKFFSHWKPGNIVENLGPLPLRQLFWIFIKDYSAAAGLPEMIISSVFTPLARDLGKKVDEVLDDESSRSMYRELLDRTVGMTRLEEYFSPHPAHNISDWSCKVRTRVSREYTKKDGTRRDKVLLQGVS